MGLLDIFKKKEQKKPTTQDKVTQREDTISIQEIREQNGKKYIEVEYYDANADFKDFYDTTRLDYRY